MLLRRTANLRYNNAANFYCSFCPYGLCIWRLRLQECIPLWALSMGSGNRFHDAQDLRVGWLRTHIITLNNSNVWTHPVLYRAVISALDSTCCCIICASQQTSGAPRDWLQLHSRQALYFWHGTPGLWCYIRACFLKIPRVPLQHGLTAMALSGVENRVMYVPCDWLLAIARRRVLSIHVFGRIQFV